MFVTTLIELIVCDCRATHGKIHCGDCPVCGKDVYPWTSLYTPGYLHRAVASMTAAGVEPDCKQYYQAPGDPPTSGGFM